MSNRRVDERTSPVTVSDDDRTKRAAMIVAPLSQTLVALTIELDNEFERRMSHRTTDVSLAMWANCLRFLDDERGTTVAELERRARMKTNLHGMQRWNYVTVDAHGVVRPTAKGSRARAVWLPVFGVVKARWRERFGGDAIDELRAWLGAIVQRLDPALPDFLPILGHGFSMPGVLDVRRAVDDPPAAIDDMPLPALLSKPLVAFALEFEARSKLSLAISANVVRLLEDDGVRVRDLPRRSGISKEAVAMALGHLERNGYVTTATDGAASGAKVATPTERGRRARAEHPTLLAALEADWRERFGANAIERVRTSLECIVRPDGGERSPLFACIVPQPENWRAAKPVPNVLPDFPTVLHRGGYPDGS